VKASPYAKKLAKEAGVDVGQATASGPQGRIVAADVLKLIESGGGKEKAASAPQAKEESSPPAPTRAEVRNIHSTRPHPL
jgi:pyruvate dehydrogenase E2 component (dihydrolipoamide acetyltransferase)